MSAEVSSIASLLSMQLRIPGYQRPYRWTTKNASELLKDIDAAIAESERFPGFKYRIGSVILHRNMDGAFDIVDGQQRMISLVLLALCLDEHANFPLLETSRFSNRETQQNLKANYDFIREWVGYQPQSWRDKAMRAFAETLEAVVIVVDHIDEAFQLFDSQNTRGRELDPHDLLKAYHLRAMRGKPYEMRHVVTRWEEFPAADVRQIFSGYLFPILNWQRGEKTHAFTDRDIDAYKGTSETTGYTYAERARRAAPSFQIGSPFIEGEDFFLMAEHYLQMEHDIQAELSTNPAFATMKEWVDRPDASVGHHYARNLFLCAMLAYYDRFHNFDERAVRKMFVWAFMARVDMALLGFGTINKYAIGQDNGRFTNRVPLFVRIARARSHTDIADLQIVTRPPVDRANGERWGLLGFLEELSKGGTR